MTKAMRVGDVVYVPDLGPEYLWTISHWTTRWTWVKPLSIAAKELGKLAEDGTIGFESTKVHHYFPERDTLL